MKARSRRVGLSAIRNIRLGDWYLGPGRCSKNFIVTEEKRD